VRDRRRCVVCQWPVTNGDPQEASNADRAPPLTSSAISVAGRGASVPFIEYEAEDAATNGSVLAMNRAAGTLAGEASGRRAVTLSGQGQFVEFTLTAQANASISATASPIRRTARASTRRSVCTSTVPRTATSI